MNKTSIFVTYSVLCLVGFAGIAVIGFSGKSNDLAAIIAFFAFYGFLCTTGVFWVLGKVKAQMEWYDERHHNTNDENSQRITEVYRSIENEVRQINSRIDDAERDFAREITGVWSAMEDVDTGRSKK